VKARSLKDEITVTSIPPPGKPLPMDVEKDLQISKQHKALLDRLKAKDKVSAMERLELLKKQLAEKK
jgi:hypothetical protein